MNSFKPQSVPRLLSLCLDKISDDSVESLPLMELREAKYRKMMDRVLVELLSNRGLKADGTEDWLARSYLTFYVYWDDQNRLQLAWIRHPFLQPLSRKEMVLMYFLENDDNMGETERVIFSTVESRRFFEVEGDQASMQTETFFGASPRQDVYPYEKRK